MVIPDTGGGFAIAGGLGAAVPANEVLGMVPGRGPAGGGGGGGFVIAGGVGIAVVPANEGLCIVPDKGRAVEEANVED